MGTEQGRNDVENFTHNQLEVSKIKHLKRIATALEGMQAALDRQNLLHSAVYRRELAEAQEERRVSKGLPEMPDENPDAAELGLMPEDVERIEREVNKPSNNAPIIRRGNSRPSIYGPGGRKK